MQYIGWESSTSVGFCCKTAASFLIRLIMQLSNRVRFEDLRIQNQAFGMAVDCSLKLRTTYVQF